VLARLARLADEGTQLLSSRTSAARKAGPARSDAQARGYVQPAVATTASRAPPVPQAVYTDLVGAVSVKSDHFKDLKADVYYNVDGYRVDDGRFTSFAAEVQTLIPAARVFTDPLRTFAYGTDASFYRLNPKMVVKVHSEEEMTRLLPLARKHQVPVTFRAAGTSLSGQALTDSVLLKISHTGKNFRNFEIHVRLSPAFAPAPTAAPASETNPASRVVPRPAATPGASRGTSMSYS
jgi:D-lactate dehydrogenase